MPTEPQPPTLAEVARRAVDACDPDGHNDALAELERRLEDRDEPITAVAPGLGRMLAEERGRIEADDPDAGLDVAVAVITYLAFRRDEIGDDREELLRLAVRAEYDGDPPPEVAAWLEEQGIAL